MKETNQERERARKTSNNSKRLQANVDYIRGLYFGAMAFCDSYTECAAVWGNLNAMHAIADSVSTLRFPLSIVFSALIDNFNKIDTYNPQHSISYDNFNLLWCVCVFWLRLSLICRNTRPKTYIFWLFFFLFGILFHFRFHYLQSKFFQFRYLFIPKRNFFVSKWNNQSALRIDRCQL